MTGVEVLLYMLIAIALGLTVFYSVKYRRQLDPAYRGFYSGRMNICMGILLVLISVIQFFLFVPSMTRIIIGLAFFLLGLFNLFSGIRGQSYYGRQIRLNRNK